MRLSLFCWGGKNGVLANVDVYKNFDWLYLFKDGDFNQGMMSNMVIADAIPNIMGILERGNTVELEIFIISRWCGD